MLNTTEKIFSVKDQVLMLESRLDSLLNNKDVTEHIRSSHDDLLLKSKIDIVNLFNEKTKSLNDLSQNLIEVERNLTLSLFEERVEERVNKIYEKENKSFEQKSKRLRNIFLIATFVNLLINILFSV